MNGLGPRIGPPRGRAHPVGPGPRTAHQCDEVDRVPEPSKGVVELTFQHPHRVLLEVGQVARDVTEQSVRSGEVLVRPLQRRKSCPSGTDTRPGIHRGDDARTASARRGAGAALIV